MNSDLNVAEKNYLRIWLSKWFTKLHTHNNVHIKHKFIMYKTEIMIICKKKSVYKTVRVGTPIYEYIIFARRVDYYYFTWLVFDGAPTKL